VTVDAKLTNRSKYCLIFEGVFGQVVKAINSTFWKLF